MHDSDGYVSAANGGGNSASLVLGGHLRFPFCGAMGGSSPWGFDLRRSPCMPCYYNNLPSVL